MIKPARYVMAAALLAFIQAPALAASEGFGEPINHRTTMALGNKPGNPALELPAGSTLISSFGERPVFSPDGSKVAFIGGSYGDAYEMDLRTGTVRNLTAHMPHKGFLRVHYLRDGSYLLLGPHEILADKEAMRFGGIEMWWLDAKASQPAQRLNVDVSEGVALSRERNRVAWAELPPGQTGIKAFASAMTTMKIADVAVVEGKATLTNVKTVMTTRDVPGCPIEAQDFLPGDRGLTFPCYGHQTRVMSVDFANRKVTTYPTPPQLYGEVEGIFPDGRHTLVECSHDRQVGADLCVLELKATNPRYRRITRIMDYGSWKYGNPTVSPDGRMIAAQIGSAKESPVDAGAGEGIVLIRVPAGALD